VEATIVLEPGRDDYHVPLLLSPYQCTIYRGS
jgi:5-hydroxyisourate hydrolase-like protein (transthyretin family)